MCNPRPISPRATLAVLCAGAPPLPGHLQNPAPSKVAVAAEPRTRVVGCTHSRAAYHLPHLHEQRSCCSLRALPVSPHAAQARACRIWTSGETSNLARLLLLCFPQRRCQGKSKPATLLTQIDTWTWSCVGCHGHNDQQTSDCFS
ncbi:hypothetical protein BS78_08G052800 [Paspalum vaginatum]|nr:hypothetical protein BS78_08G052800 [Paspalum vaginatum]